VKQVIVNHLRGKETEVYTTGMKTASLRGPVLNGRKHCFPWTELAESPQNLLGSFLADVNADVRVQQIAGFHHSPLRFCGLSFSRSTAVRSKSSSKSANRSKAANHGSIFFSQDALTAWLFPDLNTRAVPTGVNLHIYLKYVQRRMKSQNDQRLLVSERAAAQEGPCRAEQALPLLQRSGLRQSTECLAVYPSRATTSIFWSLPFWSFTFSWPPSGATTCTFSLR
jgi:hypothetical protein